MSLLPFVDPVPEYAGFQVDDGNADIVGRNRLFFKAVLAGGFNRTKVGLKWRSEKVKVNREKFKR